MIKRDNLFIVISRNLDSILRALFFCSVLCLNGFKSVKISKFNNKSPCNNNFNKIGCVLQVKPTCASMEIVALISMFLWIFWLIKISNKSRGYIPEVIAVK